MAEIKDTLKSNLAAVEERIAAACQRSQRQRAEVTLVAVTKYVDVDVARQLVELGVRDLGESRPQELWRKAAAIPEARWHLVGHLQRNKVERTLPCVSLIHSVDSLRLLKALEAEARTQERVVDVLLEHNLSGESTKHGLPPIKGAFALCDALAACHFVRVVGLMTMAMLTVEREPARRSFRMLRQLRDALAVDLVDMREEGLAIGHGLRHLSMGMTNDFEVAIEEGATLVRIGSALFQGLETRSHD